MCVCVASSHGHGSCVLCPWRSLIQFCILMCVAPDTPQKADHDSNSQASTEPAPQRTGKVSLVFVMSEMSLLFRTAKAFKLGKAVS